MNDFVNAFLLVYAALFPIVLMWFVNPIPHVFNVFVDLPLQRISAQRSAACWRLDVAAPELTARTQGGGDMDS